MIFSSPFCVFHTLANYISIKMHCSNLLISPDSNGYNLITHFQTGLLQKLSSPFLPTYCSTALFKL